MSERIRFSTLGLTLILLFGPSRAVAQPEDVSRLLRSGNESYTQGNYKAAIEKYEKILQSSFVNEVVCYNLANACFKDNQLGKAILYYEKARRLAPHDREIAENLNFARARIADKVERPPEGFFSSQLRRLMNWLPLDIETVLAVAFFVAANASFSFFWLDAIPGLSRFALYASVGFFALFLILGASNALRIYWHETLQEGVILVEKVDVLSGPASDSPTLFSIHEGLKVRIENDLPDWVQISLENGWNGWVKKEALGLI
ncbi:MAG: tetratricopeptide repeat protein [Acidobacteria bacterium]|nr:tetratricopeptide repeat protein [Acidobacteriota bacterium]MCI0624660.1 tetratricopeptide repeat protein [Acidobacteriota bacterium]MCI0719914.1 tetratricopeptide repeat protein [Acidobacteriota bacterium]